MADLPTAIHSSEFQICGITLRCHVLDDGRRIFEREGFEELFSSGFVMSEDTADALAQFIRRGEQS